MFDSGIGGLTVMKQIIHRLPHEHILYFGDTARLPYGNKSSETIIKYSIENSTLLINEEIKLLVVACNTATAHALERLQQTFDIPIVGVIEPGAQRATEVTHNKRIGVLATKSTIHSRRYELAIKERIADAHVVSIACPLFVHLVEEQLISHKATELIVRDYLDPLLKEDIDTLLLGCTHYPLLTSIIQDVVGEEVQIVDSATTCAEEVAYLLNANGLEKKISEKVSHRFMVSDDPERFKQLGQYFFGSPLHNVELFPF
jgi:glutamate racemase